MNCHFCKKEVMGIPKRRMQEYIRNKRAYCSLECSKAFCREISKNNMRNTNFKYASNRMKKNNPMSKTHIIKKMIETKSVNKTLHLPPSILGGNGRAIPLPVLLINKHLNFTIRFIQKTGMRGDYPTNYKISLADPEKKHGIFILGQWKTTRREEIQKKKVFLEKLGWKILEITNYDILRNPKAEGEKAIKFFNNT